MIVRVIIVLLVILLDSCMPARIPPSTETPVSMATAVLTPTPIPISTATARETTIPTRIMLSTPTPASISTSTPTPVVLQTTERIVFSMLSPYGTMIIQSKDWVTFDIINIIDRRVIWSFTYDRAKFGIDKYKWEAGYEPFYWSINGRYIYVKAHQPRDGGINYYGNVFGARDGLARFDVDTGTMTEILIENEYGGYTFAIAPDESGIVYVGQLEDPLVLRWRDLITDQEKTLLTFDEQIYDVGAFGWSPKMDKLIFNTLEIPNPDQQPVEFIFDFIVLDIATRQPNTVYEGFDQWLRFGSWNEQDQVYYTDWQTTVWQLDLMSNTISANGTATPSP